MVGDIAFDAGHEGSQNGLLCLEPEYDIRRSGEIRVEYVPDQAVFLDVSFLRRLDAVYRKGLEKARVDEDCLIAIAGQKAHPHLVRGVPARNRRQLDCSTRGSDSVCREDTPATEKTK